MKVNGGAGWRIGREKVLDELGTQTGCHPASPCDSWERLKSLWSNYQRWISCHILGLLWKFQTKPKTMDCILTRRKEKKNSKKDLPCVNGSLTPSGPHTGWSHWRCCRAGVRLHGFVSNRSDFPMEAEEQADSVSLRCHDSRRGSIKQNKTNSAVSRCEC